MAIQVVRTNEKLIYDFEESKVFYRRISTLKRGKIVQHHTKKGKTNWVAVTKEILEYVITGWETVEDEGVDVPFGSEPVTILPEDTLTDLLELSGGANPEMSKEEEPEKN